MCPEVQAFNAFDDVVLRRDRERRALNWCAVVLTAFGDESSDQEKQRVFAAAGIVGSVKDWEALTCLWTKRTGGKPFHAADCESDSGDFKSVSHRENLRLYADLSKLLSNAQGLVGVGFGLNLIEYRRVFPDAPEDQFFYLCFSDVVKECARVGYLSIPNESVKFTWDWNTERQYTAAYLYDYFVTHREWKFSSYLNGRIEFASRYECVEVQAADLLARETMKHLDNQIGPIPRLPRKSARSLAKRFRFSFYGKDSLESLKVLAEGLDKSNNQIGFKQWIQSKSLQDTLVNRIRYLKFLDEQEKKV